MRDMKKRQMPIISSCTRNWKSTSESDRQFFRNHIAKSLVISNKTPTMSILYLTSTGNFIPPKEKIQNWFCRCSNCPTVNPHIAEVDSSVYLMYNHVTKILKAPSISKFITASRHNSKKLSKTLMEIHNTVV